MKRKILCLLAAFMLLIMTTVSVSAETVDKTTEWVIPADTGFSVATPALASKIQFDNTGNGGNFTDLAATNQVCTGTPAVRITNNGNTGIQIEGNWTDDWQTGIEYVNISVDDCSNSTSLSYSSANEKTKQDWINPLGIGASEDFFMWSTGHEVAEGTYTTSLRFTSTNV